MTNKEEIISANQIRAEANSRKTYSSLGEVSRRLSQIDLVLSNEMIRYPHSNMLNRVKELVTLTSSGFAGTIKEIDQLSDRITSCENARDLDHAGYQQQIQELQAQVKKLSESVFEKQELSETQMVRIFSGHHLSENQMKHHTSAAEIEESWKEEIEHRLSAMSVESKLRLSTELFQYAKVHMNIIEIHSPLTSVQNAKTYRSGFSPSALERITWNCCTILEFVDSVVRFHLRHIGPFSTGYIVAQTTGIQLNLKWDSDLKSYLLVAINQKD